VLTAEQNSRVKNRSDYCYRVAANLEKLETWNTQGIL